MARNVRNLVMMYRDREFNLASRTLGTPIGRILIKNVLPQLISVIILRLALSIPGTIGMESTLSYLGLVWISIHLLWVFCLETHVATSWIIHTFWYSQQLSCPIITITFYLIGNAFSDAADPRNHV